VGAHFRGGTDPLLPAIQRRIVNRKWPEVLALAAVLTAIWYIFSGMFDLLHFGLGVLTSLLIAANIVPVEDGTRLRVARFLVYVPWLIGQIVISNLRVARSVLSPRMKIAPTFISQKPNVAGARALTMLASSVTLTPGTLSVDVGADEIFIHALDSASASDIRERILERRVGEVFPLRIGS
jgi:multicomponent Na+:H+ antiporter subunit E